MGEDTIVVGVVEDASVYMGCEALICQWLYICKSVCMRVCVHLVRFKTLRVSLFLRCLPDNLPGLTRGWTDGDSKGKLK